MYGRRAGSTATAADLVERNFTAPAPDQLWVADITYLRTWEGFLYLAVVVDACSRRVVGGVMADHLRTELVLDAVGMALFTRRPAPGLLHHSDRGYTSCDFGKTLRTSGLLTSMGRVGSAYDNAMAESFFATLRAELVYRRAWPTRPRTRDGGLTGVTSRHVFAHAAAGPEPAGGRCHRADTRPGSADSVVARPTVDGMPGAGGHPPG
jgi:transposase InsO family protein